MRLIGIKLKLILIKWSWCTVFNLCCIAKWFSYTYIYTFLIFFFHYGLSQYIEYSRTLFIHSIYTSLHLLISNSHFTPSPTSPGQPQVCPIWLWVCFVSYLLFRIWSFEFKINSLEKSTKQHCQCFLFCSL